MLEMQPHNIKLQCNFQLVAYCRHISRKDWKRRYSVCDLIFGVLFLYKCIFCMFLALLMAARLHEFNRSTGDIVKIVKVHESTLKKR